MRRKVGFEIRKLQQAINQKMEAKRVEDEIRLTQGQTRVLWFIYKNKESAYQRDIEEYLMIRRSTATQMLNTLEKNKYITRVRCDHDARLKEIQLTQKTLEIIDEMNVQLNSMEDLLRLNITEDEMDVFFKVLDQMKINIKKESL